MSDRYGFHNGGQVDGSITLSGCTNEALLQEFMNRFNFNMPGYNIIEINDIGSQYIISNGSGAQSYVNK